MMRNVLRNSACFVLGAFFLPVLTAQAQSRATENVVAQAEDAFGVSLGRETIGLYSASNVRGFSPTSAGNARIEGLYFDQVWGVTSRLRQSTTVRVGLSAFGFPFPAPTGVVDYQLRRPGDNSSQSAFGLLTSYQGASLEYDLIAPFPDQNLSLGMGIGLYNNEFASGVDSFQHIVGGQVSWRPTPQWEFQPFFARSDLYDDEAGPVLLPAGESLPPEIERRRFRGPDWADYNGVAINYGLISTWRPSSDWTIKSGFFRSLFDNEIAHTNLLAGLRQDGSARQTVIADPPTDVSSISGEVRATHTITEGARLHRIHFSGRGRDRQRETGGSNTFDLGPISIDQNQTAPRPAYAFTAQTRDSVQQWLLGVGYEGRWRERGELNLGVQRTHYEKTIAQPSLPVAVSQADAWLWNASAAVYVTQDLALYVGTTRGLEESGVAPASAANRDTALPAIETNQVEAGLRWRITPTLRSVAGVFDVRKPYFNLDEANVWRELGDVQNRGVELSLSGQIHPDVRIVAGAVLLDAQVTGEGVRLGRVGDRPVGSTPTTMLLNIDWAPQAWSGASIDFGISHNGDVVATRNNRVEIPSRTLLDVGLRYPIKVGDQNVIARARLTNLTDEYSFELAGSGAYGVSPGRVCSISLAADF
jgi:iron complex outermembrane recepter protein